MYTAHRSPSACTDLRFHHLAEINARTPQPPKRCSGMEHKGVRYELMKTANPPGWKWVVHLNSIKTQTGFSSDKQLAIHAATRAIDTALDREKKKA